MPTHKRKTKGVCIMSPVLTSLLTSAGTVVLTLTVTLLFNKFVGLPKAIKKQRKEAREKEEQLELKNQERDNKIADLQAAVDALPGYRAQSLQIQKQLKQSDKDILDACKEIKDSVLESQHILNQRLDRLESREKNALRAKILNEYRVFTDIEKNPMKAWSEMEHHSFFELVKDYEDLNGNDYVHSEVLPAMNRLTVIPMSDLAALEKMYKSRKI